MNKYEYFALGEHLSAWPENMTYLEVLESVREQNNEQVEISEDFQYLLHDDLSDRIESFRLWLEECFIPREGK